MPARLWRIRSRNAASGHTNQLEVETRLVNATWPRPPAALPAHVRARGFSRLGLTVEHPLAASIASSRSQQPACWPQRIWSGGRACPTGLRQQTFAAIPGQRAARKWCGNEVCGPPSGSVGRGRIFSDLSCPIVAVASTPGEALPSGGEPPTLTGRPRRRYGGSLVGRVHRHDGGACVKLSEITAGSSIEGLEPGLVCTIAAASPLGNDAVELFYKRPDGSIATRLVTAAEAASPLPQRPAPSPSTATRPPFSWPARRSGSTSPFSSTR